MIKGFRIPILAAGLIVAFSFRAYAKATTLSSVTISVKETKGSPGEVWSPEVTSTYGTTISDVKFSSEDLTPGKTVTITVTVTPSENYKVQKSSTKVYASGAELSNSSVSSSKITAKLNYLPKVTLEAPSDVWMDDEYIAEWNKVDYATSYEVTILKNNSSYKTLTTTKTELDISSYITFDEAEMGFKVRAIAKNDNQAKYLKASAWTVYGDSVSASDENTVYGGFTGTGSSLRFKDDDGDYAKGWQYIGGAWYYFEQSNGYAQTGWQLINNVWYYIDPNTAIMTTGWQYINNHWYFFDTSGAMRVGWMQAGPNGYWYYLDTTYGALWQNTVTPDGYTVNADGVWIQ